MARTVNRRERRIQILEALHRCLLEKSFHQTSIKDIAHRAGVNHGLLHYYFENKKDILLTYIDYTFENYYGEFQKRFAHRFKQGASPAADTEERFQWVLNEVAFNGEYARIFTEIWALAIHDDTIRQKLHDLYNRWKNSIMDLVKPSGRDGGNSSRIGLTMIALTEGLSLFSALFTREELCDDIRFSALLNVLEKPMA